MRATDPTLSGGEGKVGEADEAHKGRKEAPIVSPHRQGHPYLKSGTKAEKRPIFTLIVARQARAFSMPVVSSKNGRDKVTEHADHRNRLHTDESRLYDAVGELAHRAAFSRMVRDYPKTVSPHRIL